LIDSGTAPDPICAVTFNRRAADELEERLTAALEPLGVAQGAVRVRTFHALGREMLRAAGHTGLADDLDRDLVGRNVVADRWTFQIVEDYDDGYYASFKRIEQEVRSGLGDAPRHGYEQQLKDARRTHGRPGHEPGRPSS